MNSIEELRQFHANNAYCCDDVGNVIGICACENEIGMLKIPKELGNLIYLNLGDNKSLTQLEFEGALPQLSHMDISDSGLKSLHLPNGFEKLDWLDLSRNQLNTLDIAGILPELAYMDVTSNQLQELNVPAPKLKLFYLNDNKLHKLVFPKIPKSLEVLQLRNNQLEELPEKLLSMKNLKVLYLNGNPLSALSQELYGKGKHYNAWKEVKLYLEGIKKSGGELEYLHQAKMVLVGNGMVGKTSICVKLLDKKAPLPKEEERTPGLHITLYKLKEIKPDVTKLDKPIDFKLNLWDFGGQGKYRELQQMFCSRKTLYLFVTSKDDTPEEREDYVGFEYWLSMINAYSFDSWEKSFSPVIYVVNKIDKGEKLIDAKDTVDKFNNINKFARISCETLEHFDELEEAILETLPKISKNVFSDQYPKEWIYIKDELERIAEETDENYISYTRYLEVCDDKLSEEEAKNWLSILDRIGTIIYFGDNELLKDWIILNPQWVKEALFNVLDSPLINNGVMRQEHFSFIWPDNGFHVDEYPKLLELMKKYKLCYEGVNQFGEKEYIVPALLSDTAPELPDLLQNPTYSFEIRYTPFLPAGTVNKLIVDMQSLTFENKIWKNNLIVQDGYKTYAHIREEWQDGLVYIDFFGKEANHLYHSIISKLENLKDELVNTRYLEHLNTEVFAQDEGKWESMETLEKFKAEHFSRFWENVEMRERPELVQPAPAKLKVFISYAHQDDHRLFKAFVKGLNEYSYGEWEIFDDRNILIGQDWNERLQKEVAECDFAIFLLSPNFFRSEYIKKNEFNNFISRNVQEGFNFFSLLLRRCDFKRWEELAKHQIFSSYGRDYGQQGDDENEIITFSRIEEIRSGDTKDKYFENLVKEITRALNKDGQ